MISVGIVELTYCPGMSSLNVNVVAEWPSQTSAEASALNEAKDTEVNSVAVEETERLQPPEKVTPPNKFIQQTAAVLRESQTTPTGHTGQTAGADDNGQHFYIAQVCSQRG